MRSILSKQLANILFITLTVLCALALIIVSRRDKNASTVAEATASPSSAPTKTPKPSFVGVPKAVLETHLLTSERYAAVRETGEDNAWTLTKDGNDAALIFTLDEGKVSLIELSVALPTEEEKTDEKKTDSKKKATPTPLQSAIEQRLKENGAPSAAAPPDETLRTLLNDLLAACDRDGAISQASIRLWTESAVDAMLAGKSYKADGDGCKFQAIPTTRGGREMFVCTLYMD